MALDDKKIINMYDRVKVTPAGIISAPKSSVAGIQPPGSGDPKTLVTKEWVDAHYVRKP